MRRSHHSQYTINSTYIEVHTVIILEFKLTRKHVAKLIIVQS